MRQLKWFEEVSWLNKRKYYYARVSINLANFQALLGIKMEMEIGIEMHLSAIRLNKVEEGNVGRYYYYSSGFSTRFLPFCRHKVPDLITIK